MTTTPQNWKAASSGWTDGREVSYTRRGTQYSPNASPAISENNSETDENARNPET